MGRLRTKFCDKTLRLSRGEVNRDGRLLGDENYPAYVNTG